MNDTGLLCAACMDNIQFELLNGNIGINMGSILENAIAQQLAAGGFSLFYYDSTAHGEVDFAVQNGTGVNLIEVKSGADYRRHKALDNVMAVKEWAFRESYVLCGGNVESSRSGILYLPWYMCIFLRQQEAPRGLIWEPDISGL